MNQSTLRLMTCISNKGRSDLIVGNKYEVQDDPDHPSGEKCIKIFKISLLSGEMVLYSYALAELFVPADPVILITLVNVHTFDHLFSALKKKFGDIFLHDNPPEGGWTIGHINTDNARYENIQSFIEGFMAAHP